MPYAIFNPFFIAADNLLTFVICYDHDEYDPPPSQCTVIHVLENMYISPEKRKPRFMHVRETYT